MGFRGARTQYDDPAYYWYAYRRRRKDVHYYRSLIEGTPNVLEYGVGNGRVALELARAGATVTGVDTSQRMLDDFRTRLGRQSKRLGERVRLLQGDMRRVRLLEQFELVIAPFNTIQHLFTATDFERFLSRVRAHLRPGASFVFDFTLPRPQDLARPSDQVYKGPSFRHPTFDCEVGYFERFSYDPTRQLLKTRMEFVPVGRLRPWSVLLTQRQWFPREVEALLHYAGFGPTRFLADFDLGASFEAVDTVVVQTSVRSGSKPRKKGPRGTSRRARAPLHEA